MIYMTGFADEAGADLDTQIRATKELGWSNIESRAINGKNIHDISDGEFDVVYGKLQDAGIKVNCFGSTIANWQKQINEPMSLDLEQIARAIPRMKRLGTKLIRIMSYAVLKDRSPEDQMFEERISRLKTIVKMFLDEGIQPVHENCMNYGGMGWSYTMCMLDNVPGLKLVFDTGNPVILDDRTKPLPFPKQSSWEFYDCVKDHVVYVHIKDAVMKDGKEDYRWPGEGDGDVKKICADLVSRGYSGGISIEPHLGVVFHDPTIKADPAVQYAKYVEYGRRTMAILNDLGAKIS